MTTFVARSALALAGAGMLLSGIVAPAWGAPATPADLTLKVSVLSDGTPGFDADDTAGNDSSATNGIVRVNDTVTYQVEYGVGGSTADDLTFTLRLPRGLEMTEVPAYCVGGGSLTPATYPTPTLPLTPSSIDQLPEQTLTCNVGSKTAATERVNVTARVSNLLANAQRLTVVSAGLTAASVTTPVVAGNLPAVTTSSRLKWDLSKNSVATTPDTGYVYGPATIPCPWDTALLCKETGYNVTLSAPSDGKGAMPAIGAITFVDDLSPEALYPQLSAAQIAAFKADLNRYGSRIQAFNYTYQIPGSKIGRAIPGAGVGTATNAVRDSGTVTVTQPAGPGTAATVTITGADTTLRTYPTQVGRPAGAAVPSGQAYAVALHLRVYTPLAAISDFGPPDDSGQRWVLRTRNTYSGLQVQGLTAADTLTTAGQPTANDYRTTYPDVSVGEAFAKYYAGVPGAPRGMTPSEYVPDDPWVGEGPQGGAVRGSGTITAAPTQEIVSVLYTRGAKPDMPTMISQVMCDSWDSSLLHLKAKDWPASTTAGGQMVPSNGAAVWVSGYRNLLAANGVDARDATSSAETPPITVQYSATPGGPGSASECGDAAGPWYDSPADVPGNDPAKLAQGVFTAVSRVRVHITLPAPVGTSYAFGTGYPVHVSLGMEVAESGRATGTPVPNWGNSKRVVNQSVDMAGVLAASTTWSRNTYDPATHTGTLGDRVLLADGQARVTKLVRKGTGGTFEATPPNVTGGDTVQYQLSPSLTSGALATGVLRDVWVEDCLPEAVGYVSAVPAPAVVSTATPADAKRAACPAGSTYLRWVLTGHEVNTPITPIVVTTEVSPMVPDGAYPNTVEVWAQGDESTTAQRTASATIQVANVAGLRITKDVLTPTVQVNRDGQATDEVGWWRLHMKNTNPPTGQPLADAEMIDVFPKHGVAGSSLTGRVVLAEVRAVTGTPVWLYTSAADVDPDPQHPSNTATGSTTWCDAPAGGQVVSGTGTCPTSITEVTALRIRQPGPFVADQSLVVEVGLKGVGDAEGDVRVNRVAGIATGLLNTTGPIARSQGVVSSSLGDRFWVDSDGDGVQDAGEPGVANATVRLSGADDLGNQVSVETTTAADGTYRFTGLRASGPAGYTVTFVVPDALRAEGYQPTVTRAGGDPAADSDADASGAATVVLGRDSDVLTVDAGIAQARVDLTKTASTASVRPGDVVTYTFTAVNTGTVDLTDVALAETSFTDAHGAPATLDAPPALQPQSTGTPALLRPGQMLVWTATFTVETGDLTVGGSLANTAQVTGRTGHGTVVSDSDTVSVASAATAGYVVSKAASAPGSRVAPGDTVTYTLTVRHTGDLPVTGAALTDDLSGVLDDATGPADARSSSGTLTLTDRTLRWTGDLEVGQVVTVTYAVTVTSDGDRVLRNVVAPADDRGTCEQCQTRHRVVVATPALPGTGAAVTVGVVGLASVAVLAGLALVVRRRPA